MLLWNNDFYKALTIHDEPPTLYSIMESIVNFDKEEDDKVKIRNLAEASKNRIFDFNYPISDNFGKDKFEELFLKHFMFRRINYDTMTSFKLHLEVKLNDIMPKYNKMIDDFVQLNFDGDVETHLRTQSSTNVSNSIGSSSGETSSTGNSSLDSRNSDTPQNRIDDVRRGEYVTDYTYNQNSSTDTSTSESNMSSNSSDQGNVEENITIKRADSIDEYNKYLQITSTIYSMIFADCDSLFYGII